MTPGSRKPEELARERIDDALERAGWILQDRAEMNLSAGRGVAVREFPMETDGFADYLLFVDGSAAGVLEAKPAGYPLTSVEPQAQQYAEGFPGDLPAPLRPLPFVYLSTGVETRHWNLLDPQPRDRRLFHMHRPETLAEWLTAEPLPKWQSDMGLAAERAPGGAPYSDRPSTLRSRLQTLPPVHLPGLWPNKIKAIKNLEESLYHDWPRALIQMATGSGKTLLAITEIYRLIKYAGARRILFLVDRSNLGVQAEKEFQGYRTPDTQAKFTDLYNVQRLTTNHIGSASKVVITTIQRLYSMLKGEDLDPEAEEGSQFDPAGQLLKEPVPVAYNPTIPVEFFDFVFIDECHRSIYSLWRQVVEYFDAYLIGLTATPAKQTFGFFHRNLVMEYSHDEAVADGVNVDFEVYRIRTKITTEGGKIEAEAGTVLPIRDRQTRAVRWEQPDEDIEYSASDLDKAVVAKDQIRTVIRTFRDRLFTEIFPGRKDVPKTLIFAKDDSHAEDIVQILREEFGKGNEFARKITYKSTGRRPKDLIQDFRNSYFPRIAVTVDMIATGTDIKPVEIVMFLRTVRSRVYFEQMKGRGVRVIDQDELRAVTPDAKAKTHFVIVDCAGISETELADTQPLERKRHVAFKKLLDHVAAGGTDPDVLSSLASRLARLDRQCGPKERERIAAASDGLTLEDIAHKIVKALDPDEQIGAAREKFGVASEVEPTDEQVQEAATELYRKAAQPLATNPPLRQLLQDLKKQFEQIIDEISQDELLEAGYSEEAREKARQLVESFEQFIDENRDEIDALQFFYTQPYGRRLRYEDIKELANAIEMPPRSWTPEKLWRAYKTLDKSRVLGASAQRLLTDLVSLVRYALHEDDALVPYATQVQERFDVWIAQQENQGRQFTPEQMRWLVMMKDHIATSLEIEPEDLLELEPFSLQGGLGKARQVFGPELDELIGELNEVLAA